MERYNISLRGGLSFHCEPESSVLEGMMARRRSDIAVGCRGGGCGVCKVRVLEGDYRAGPMSSNCVSADEREQGFALACKLFPRTDLHLEVVGKIQKVLARRVRSGQTASFRDSWNQKYQDSLTSNKEN